MEPSLHVSTVYVNDGYEQDNGEAQGTSNQANMNLDGLPNSDQHSDPRLTDGYNSEQLDSIQPNSRESGYSGQVERTNDVPIIIPVSLPIEEHNSSVDDVPVMVNREQNMPVNDVPVIIPSALPVPEHNSEPSNEVPIMMPVQEYNTQTDLEPMTTPEHYGSTYDVPMTAVFVKNLARHGFNGRAVVHVQNLNQKEVENKHQEPQGTKYPEKRHKKSIEKHKQDKPKTEVYNGYTKFSYERNDTKEIDENKHKERLEKKKIADQAKRDRKPLFFVKLITDHPKKALGITVAGHLFFMVLTGILFVSGYDILPIVFNSFPLDLREDIDYLRAEAWDWRFENDDIIERGKGETTATTRSELLDTLSLIFFIEGGNVLTKENLQRIRDVENRFLDDEQFKSKLCRLTTEGGCVQPLSLVRFFDGTYADESPIFNDTEFDNIVGVINEANRNDKTKATIQLLLAKSAVLEPDRVESWITISFLSIGQPLAGYTHTLECLSCDRDDEQLLEAESIVLDAVAPIGDEYFSGGVGEMSFAYGSMTYFNAYIFNQVVFDLALAIGSIFAVGIFICLQTWSLWIGGLAVFGVFMSFMEANIIYRVVLSYRYIGVFHVLAVFIVLGIGADDVFVFCDTWKETGQYKYKSLAHRLSDAYRRSALAMFFTSLTTAAAFIVSATSPFLVISAFGVFSGLLIAVNYISVIVYLPCVVIVYHLYFEKYKCCCCCPRENPEESPENSDKERKPKKTRSNLLVKFFHGPYYNLITHKYLRWVIVLIYLTILGLFAFFASRIQVEEEQVEYVSESLNLGKFLKLQGSQAFIASDNIRKVHVVFGMKPQDRSTCHISEALCSGETVWDENFNMDSPRVQQSLLDFCNAIRNLPDEDVDYLEIRRDPVTGVPEVDCFVEPMQQFYEEEENRVIEGTRRYPVGTDLPIPTDGTTVESIMEYNADIYNSSYRAATDWNSDTETAVSFWMYNGFQLNEDGIYITSPDFKKYDPLTGESKDTPTVVKKNTNGITYYYGTKLKYVGVLINTTINDQNLAYITGLPLRDKWEEIINNEISKLEPELQGGFQCTPRGNTFSVWHWIKVQERLVQNAVIGLVIGLSIALPILIIATNNFVTGLIATFTLLCITVTVSGLIDAAGWKLGFLESVNMVLVVGLSVDYCVHLAEGYSRSSHTDRKNRTRDSLTEVGISVTSGALTSCTAACFLLFAKITFFRRFGMFMLSTLGFSLFWALGFFPTLCAIIGPQNDFGNVTMFFKSLWAKCKRNK